MKQLTYRILLKKEEEVGLPLLYLRLLAVLPMVKLLMRRFQWPMKQLLYISKALLPMVNQFLMNQIRWNITLHSMLQYEYRSVPDTERTHKNS